MVDETAYGGDSETPAERRVRGVVDAFIQLVPRDRQVAIRRMSDRFCLVCGDKRTRFRGPCDCDVFR